jgi:hypothetical protein
VILDHRAERRNREHSREQSEVYLGGGGPRQRYSLLTAAHDLGGLVEVRRAHQHLAFEVGVIGGHRHTSLGKGEWCEEVRISQERKGRRWRRGKGRQV